MGSEEKVSSNHAPCAIVLSRELTNKHNNLSSENSAALVPSKLNDKPMTTASQLPMKGILVSSANILITISMGEVAVLLYHINEASESLCRLRHCPGPEIPHDTHPISVFLDIQRIHGTLFRQSVPCARLVASGKDVCFGAKDFEILSTIKQHSWVRQFDNI